MRFLLRSASHAYFPVAASVIHIPDPDAELRERITTVYDLIKGVKSAAQIDMLRDLQEPVRIGLEGVRADEAFAEVARRRDGQPVPKRSRKRPKLRFSSPAAKRRTTIAS